MIHLYVGDGKGKTTAAVGLTLRFLGSDKAVLFAALLKDGTSGEMSWLKSNRQLKLLCQTGLTRFFKDMTEAERQETMRLQRQILSETVNCCDNFEAVILDELTDLIELEIITVREAVEAINAIAAKDCEVIITGHKTFPDLIELADYYTEFICHKHPFSRGIKARKGVEF